MLASGGYNKEVWLWDLASEEDRKIAKKKPKKIFREYTGNVKAVEFSADGKVLITGGMERQVRIWDVNGGWLKVLESPERSFEAVTISPSGKVVVGNSSFGPIIIWDLASGKILKTLTGHVLEGDSLAFRPDGKVLASGNKDKTITLWDTQTWEPRMVLTGNTGRIESLAFSPDGKTLANGGGGGDTSIKLWDLSGVAIN